LPKAQVNSSHITGITALFISDLPNASSKLTNHFAQRKQNRFWDFGICNKNRCFADDRNVDGNKMLLSLNFFSKGKFH